MKINKDVDRIKLFADHSDAIWIAKCTMDKEAQPLIIEALYPRSVELSVRMNLTDQQLHRLIVEPISDNLRDMYKVTVNKEARMLKLLKINQAMKISDSKKVK